jgi:hypothetical protein
LDWIADARYQKELNQAKRARLPSKRSEP